MTSAERWGVYLVGAPATGKSSTMAALRAQLGLTTGAWYKVWPDQHGEFRGEPLVSLATGWTEGLSLGVTRPGFSGTDAIGMASHSEALRWAQLADDSIFPELVLGEGARLGTGGFLAALAQRLDLTVGYLVAEEEVLDERCAARGSTQKLRFRKGQATRSRRAAELAAEAGIPVVQIDSSSLSPEESARLLLEAARS